MPQILRLPSSVTFFYQEFQGFYALRQHRNNQHTMQIGSGTRDVDVEHIVGDIEEHMLREELRSCQHLLVDSELETARYKVFNYAVQTLNETIVNEKLDHFLNSLKCATKVNLVSGFILKNKEDGRFTKFTHTKIITCWTDEKWCAPKTT